MENVAHALAGILLAELALTRTNKNAAPENEGQLRAGKVAVVVSALANNVPDTDLLYSWITPGPLGYLLHHRGHTHTLPIAMTLGLLVAALALRVAKPTSHRRLILLLGLFGPVLHLLMDAWNIYGVHPFWPFDSRWYYGDRIFILEPLLWVTAIPSVFRNARSRAFRILLGGLSAFIVVVPWFAGSFIPWQLSLLISGVFALSVFVASRTNARRRIVFACAAWLSVLLAFSLARLRAEQQVMLDLYDEHPDAIVHDVALTPLPSNPFCWNVYLTMVPEPSSDTFIVRRGTATPFISGLCPRSPSNTTAQRNTTAQLVEVDASPKHVVWAGEARLSQNKLRELAARCDVGAAMRFYRTPFWVEHEDSLLLGDLRFDRTEGRDFPELTLTANAPAQCPRFVPNWQPPRQRLLEGGD